MRFVKALWLYIPGVFSVIGLSGVVDGVVAWYSFMQDIVAAYVSARAYVEAAVFDWWSWFEVPDLVSDIFIIYFLQVFACRLVFPGSGGRLALYYFPAILPLLFWPPITFKILIKDNKFARSIMAMVFSIYQHKYYAQQMAKQSADSPATSAKAAILPPVTGMEGPQELMLKYIAYCHLIARDYFMYLLKTLGIFVVLLFLNWQVLQRLPMP